MKTSDDLHDGQDGRSADAGARFDAVLEPLTRAAERFGQIGIIQRWGWLIAIGLAVVIAGIGIGIFVLALLIAGWPDFWFHDLEVLLDATRRLFAGESWYLERQLHGPYPAQFGDVMYPPVAGLVPRPVADPAGLDVRCDPGRDPGMAHRGGPTSAMDLAAARARPDVPDHAGARRVRQPDAVDGRLRRARPALRVARRLDPA